MSPSRAPAPGSPTTSRRGSPRSASAWRRSVRSSGRTCSPTRSRFSSSSRGPTISPACRTGWSPRRPRAAAERGLPGKHVVTLARSSVEPFLQFSARRDLREKAFAAWAARGEHSGPTDNRTIADEIVRLRAEYAKLLGFESFAEFRLADTMAKTPAAARALLESVWTPALARAAEEEAALQEIVAEEGGNFEIAPWDWRFYAEKRRKRLFDVDEDAIKPYLQLDKMIEAAFFAAGRLFGLSFVERFDIPLYHPDVRAWTVLGRDGAPIALFIGDYFARPSKRSGAWMSAFRRQREARRRRSADRRQRPQPGQGRGGRSRRCSASTRRGRCSTNSAMPCTGCCPTSPIRCSRARGSRPTSSSFPRRCTSTGSSSPRFLRRFAVHRGHGEPMPEAMLEKLVSARKVQPGFCHGRIRGVGAGRPRTA